MSREHELKISDEFFDDVASGRKPFEIRYNDRGYQTGDYLRLREYFNGFYGQRETRKRITYMLNGWGLQEGYVALGLEPADVTASSEGEEVKS